MTCSSVGAQRTGRSSLRFLKSSKQAAQDTSLKAALHVQTTAHMGPHTVLPCASACLTLTSVMLESDWADSSAMPAPYEVALLRDTRARHISTPVQPSHSRPPPPGTAAHSNARMTLHSVKGRYGTGSGCARDCELCEGGRELVLSCCGSCGTALLRVGGSGSQPVGG